jgi:FkbM family methyltransferase
LRIGADESGVSIGRAARRREKNRGSNLDRTSERFITFWALAESLAGGSIWINLQESHMPVADPLKSLINRSGLHSISLPLMNGLARLQRNGVRRIFVEDGIWMHETSQGYFAYHQPYLRLDLSRLDEIARRQFLWGYTPRAGDVIMDVGAGVGEETPTFSRAVGGGGKVICIEAHPRTFRCLKKLVAYNRLANVIPVFAAVTEPGCSQATIGNNNEYLANRVGAAKGVSVPATTIDAIHRQLNLGPVHLLKMNIEGSERRAIQGMAEILKQAEILCVSCHDFLARAAGDDELRTKGLVGGFLRQNGFEIVERTEPTLPPYVRDQLWAYNRELMR